MAIKRNLVATNHDPIKVNKIEAIAHSMTSAPANKLLLFAVKFCKQR